MTEKDFAEKTREELETMSGDMLGSIKSTLVLIK